MKKIRIKLTESNKISSILRECKSGDKNKETSVYYLLFIISFIISGVLFMPFLLYAIYPIAGYVLIGIFYLLIYLVVFGAYFLYKLMRIQQSIRILDGVISSLKNSDWLWAKEAVFNSPDRIDPSVIKHPSAMHLLGQILLYNGEEREGATLIDIAKSKDANLEKINISSTLNEKDALYFRESLSKADNLRIAYFFRKMWAIKTIRYLIFSSLVFVLFLHFLILFSRIGMTP